MQLCSGDDVQFTKADGRIKMSLGGRKNREKGDRFERAIVKCFRDHGFDAERVPLSGSGGGSFKGDIHSELLGRKVIIEAKSRANGFVLFYGWLMDRDAVVIKADQKEPLIVLRLDRFLEFMKGQNLSSRSVTQKD